MDVLVDFLFSVWVADGNQTVKLFDLARNTVLPFQKRVDFGRKVSLEVCCQKITSVGVFQPLVEYQQQLHFSVSMEGEE